MKIGHYIIDTYKYDYLKPLWPILEQHPQGISLKNAVKQSKLDQDTMLKTIETLAQEYQRCSSKLMRQGMIKNLATSMLNGEKTDETLKQDLATSWIFDKVMLYDRIHELNWTKNVIDFGVLDEIKELWKKHKGI